MAHSSTGRQYAQAPPPGGSGLRGLIEDVGAALVDAETARAALIDEDRGEALEALRACIARIARLRAHIHEWGHV